MTAPFFYPALISFLLISLCLIVIVGIGYFSRKNFEERHPDFESFSHPSSDVKKCVICFPLITLMLIYSASKGAVRSVEELTFMSLVLSGIGLALPASANICLFVGNSRLFAMNLFGKIREVNLSKLKLAEEKIYSLGGGYTFLVGKTESLCIWHQFSNSQIAILNIKNLLKQFNSL